MPPESHVLLGDMLQAATLIQSFAAGRTLDEFKNDKQFRSAIYWQFTVIGEALTKLHRSDAATSERITEWHRIIAFRNQIIHGYSIVDDETSWGIIAGKLPILVREVELLLSQASENC